jgi:hypothetical protein
MNLDTIARVHAQQAQNTVVRAAVPPLSEIVPDGRRLGAGWAMGLTVGAGAAILAVVLVARQPAELPFGSPATTNSTVAPVTTTSESPNVVTTPAFEPPLVAPPGPQPLFDTTGLGIEQPLAPIDGLNSFGRRVLSQDSDLVIEEAIAIGYVPYTSQVVLAISGVINNPGQAGYGEQGRCYWVTENETEGLGDCHWILPDTAIRPIGVGLVGRSWVGWSFLPAEASVTVLNIDGVDRFWQQPRSDVTIFSFAPTTDLDIRLRVLDADGVEIGHGDLTRPAEPTEPTVEPILGYGDFSNIAYEDIDWFEVTALTVQCVNDQGYGVTVIPPGDGINKGDVPDEQNRDMQFAMAACRAGLNIPEAPGFPDPPS